MDNSQLQALMLQIKEKAENRNRLWEQHGNSQEAVDAYLKKMNRPYLFEDFYPELSIDIGDIEMNYDPSTNRWNLDVGTLDIMKDNTHAQEWFAKNHPGLVWDNLKEDTRKLMAMSYSEDFVDLVPEGSVVNIKGAPISSVTDQTSGAKVATSKKGKSIAQRKQDIYNKRFLKKPGFSLENGNLVFTKNSNNIEAATKFNVNNLGETELRRFAENWLTNNPGKTLREFKKENGYNGPALKTKQRKGQPIRVSFKDAEKAKLYQQNRLNQIQPKTESEAAYVRGIQKQAKVQSDDLIHQLTYGGRPSVAEHNLRGDNEAMSISNPDFAGRKTDIETRALKKGYLTGIDNVTGEAVVAPEDSFNKYDPSSSPGARIISEGEDIATVIGKLPTKAEGVRQLGNIITNNPVTRGIGIGNDARLASIVENVTDLAKGIPPGARFSLALLPGLGIVGDTADAAIKHQEAIDDPTLLNKAQDWVAASVAATSIIPTPTAQAYNFGAGLLLGGSDLVEHFGEKVVRSIGGAPQWFIDKFKEKQQLGYQDRVLNHPYYDNTNTSTTPG